MWNREKRSYCRIKPFGRFGTPSIISEWGLVIFVHHYDNPTGFQFLRECVNVAIELL